jgi:hypothetical protein
MYTYDIYIPESPCIRGREVSLLEATFSSSRDPATNSEKSVFFFFLFSFFFQLYISRAPGTPLYTEDFFDF